MMRRAARSWSGPLALAGLTVSAAVVYFLGSLARYESFFSGNWDLGINMQMLWSTTHGRLLYEAGDFESQGTNSFLLVHPTYLALPLAYAYALSPTAAFLFALQAAFLSSSAIPLYLIGRRAGLGPTLSLAAVSVYLISFPLVSGVLFDFHWESLIPVEFLFTYYLWTGRRYYWAMVPALLGCLTLEVFPLLLLGLLLYGASPWLKVLISHPREALGKLRAAWPQARPWIGLAIFAVSSYVALRISEHNLIGPLVGSPAAGAGTQVSDALSALFLWGATGGTFVIGLVYWALLLAAFGLVPLLARQRLLLLSVPWLISTLIEDPFLGNSFGNQYALIAIAPIAIGFAEGLAVLSTRSSQTEPQAVSWEVWPILIVPFAAVCLLASVQLLGPTSEGTFLAFLASVLTLAVYVLVRRARAPWSPWAGSGTPPDPAPRAIRPPSRERRWRRPVALGAALTVLVAVNLVMSPLNPANYGANNQPGYEFTWISNPAYPYVHDLVALIPAGSVVLASNNLFPYVANNVHAYSLSWYLAPLPYLPFNASHLPEFVLASASQLGLLPLYLAQAVSNRSVYGIAGLVYATAYPGSLYLYRLGFNGTAAFWQAVPAPNPIELCPSDLAVGPSGVLLSQSGTRCGSEIASSPASNLTGRGTCIWYGPYISLLPGSYIVTVSLEGIARPGISPSQPLLFMDAGGFGTPRWYATTVAGAQLNPTQWTEFEYNVVVPEPVSQAEFRGYVTVVGGLSPANVTGTIHLQYVEIQRV